MTLAVSPPLATVLQKVGAYLVDATHGILPVGTRVIEGPINRASQPTADHCILTPIGRTRLRTNVETDVDPYPSPGAGSVQLETGTRMDLQVDFYGAQAADWAAKLVAIWRSPYAAERLAPECAPLYADDGRMIPLVTGEEQYLTRWTVTAALQYNPVTTTPQQFAGEAVVALIDVDERYPP